MQMLQNLINQLLADGMLPDDALHDALCEYAERVLTQSDCEAWAAGETTPLTERLIELFDHHGFTLTVWGSPEGREPLTVTA